MVRWDQLREGIKSKTMLMLTIAQNINPGTSSIITW